jgi:hypothetical protein
MSVDGIAPALRGGPMSVVKVRASSWLLARTRRAAA